MGIYYSIYKDNWFFDSENKKVIEDLVKWNLVYYCIYVLGEFVMLDKFVFLNY